MPPTEAIEARPRIAAAGSVALQPGRPSPGPTNKKQENPSRHRASALYRSNPVPYTSRKISGPMRWI